jgi:hypothetical protein
MKKNWQKLLDRLEVLSPSGRRSRSGQLSPVASADLDHFELSRGLKLPQSYRMYCELFGPGEFAEEVRIAVPAYRGRAMAFSLEHIDKAAHEGMDFEEYSRNPDQHKRALFFATGIARSYHFFDPEDVTHGKSNEYAVYTLFKNFKLQRTADDFWLFVAQCCLGERHNQILDDEAPRQAFMPASV